MNKSLTTSFPLFWTSISNINLHLWNSSVPKISCCTDILSMPHSCRTIIACKFSSVDFLHLFYGRELCWRMVQVHMRWERHSEEAELGKKCEYFGLVAAQSDRLPMWKGLTVNPPLSQAWSWGNASQSPACLSYLRTAGATICQLFIVATWAKCVPPLHIRRDAPLIWQIGIWTFDVITAVLIIVCQYSVSLFLGVKLTIKQCKNQSIFFRSYL